MKKHNNFNETSTIVCNKNSFFHLKQSLPKLININFGELTFIDANSVDKFIDYIKSKGLSYARYLGSKLAKKIIFLIHSLRGFLQHIKCVIKQRKVTLLFSIFTITLIRIVGMIKNIK